MPSVALIGSFRKHYQQILDVRRALRYAGIVVTTPQGNPVLDDQKLFVRFDEEFEGEDDDTVQCYALHRILRSDAVYVVVPEGYIGFVEEFPGANTQGATLEETRANLREAVTLVVETNRMLALEDAAGGDVIREPLKVTA